MRSYVAVAECGQSSESGANSGMRFRKLRIAWSVIWGLACVLIVVFWGRSYWYADTISSNALLGGWVADMTWCDGRLRFSAYNDIPAIALWEWNSTRTDVERRFLRAQM